MKGIILAAGRGSRMHSATAEKPKCMTILAGKSLLQWQLGALHGAGVDEIAVVCGYKAEVIAEACFSVSVHRVINPHWETTNMVSSLLCAREWAEEEDCIISYSDIVYSPEHVKLLLQSDYPIGITYDTLWESLWKLRFPDPLTDAETFREENGSLLEIGKKTQQIDKIQGQYMGLIKLGPAGWASVRQVCADLGEATARTDMTTLLAYLLEKGIPVAAVPVNGKWCEVDTQNDLALYERMHQCCGWSHDWRE